MFLFRFLGRTLVFAYAPGLLAPQRSDTRHFFFCTPSLVSLVRVSLCVTNDARVKPTIVGLLVFLSTVWAPVDKLLGFLVTLNTRKNEFEADQYSVDLDYGTAPS